MDPAVSYKPTIMTFRYFDICYVSLSRVCQIERLVDGHLWGLTLQFTVKFFIENMVFVIVSVRQMQGSLVLC